MRPLGFIEDWKTFSKDFQEVLKNEHAIGILLDCPKHQLLRKSGLIHAQDSVTALDDLMKKKMSIYFISPGKPLPKYSEEIKKFNDHIILGLNINFRVNYPCLILFKSKGETLSDRTYLDLKQDMCLYFNKVHQAISDYLKDYDDKDSQYPHFVKVLQNTYETAKSELPKVTLIKSLELAVMSLGVYIFN